MSEELPEGWATVKLRLLLAAPLANGRSVPTDDDGFPVLRLTAIRNGVIDLNARKGGAWNANEAAPFLVKEGDFLVSRGNGSVHLVGRGALVAIPPDPVAFPDTMIRIRPASDLLDPRYLALVWNSLAIRSQIERAARTTAGIHKINQRVLEDIDIPLPPLAEQRRIVDALEVHISRLEAASTSLQSAQLKLSNFHRSIHASAFIGTTTKSLDFQAGPPHGEVLAHRAKHYGSDQRRGRPNPLPPRRWNPIKFPDHWTLCSLEEVTHPIRTISYGILKPGPHQEDGVPYVRVVNMRGDRISVADLHRTTPEIDAQYARSRLTGGDVLVSIRGTYGRICLVPDALAGANITQDTARLALLDFVDPRFACIYLRSGQAQHYFRSVARGVAVKGVNIGDLRDMPFPVPSLAEQRAIVQRVDELMSEYDAAMAAVVHGNRRVGHLSAAILRQAFIGKLVPQNPADEPVSSSLKRIDADRNIGLPMRRAQKSSAELTPLQTSVGNIFTGIQEELPL